MKKIFISFAFLAAVAMAGNAKELSESEAMNVANSFLNGTPSMMRAPLKGDATLSTAYTARSTDNEHVLYVFNRGEENGFVIVSADDAVDNMVLGYSDSGNFDYESIPENMRAWLKGYEQEIASMRMNGEQHAAADVYVSQFNKNVGPLVEARWGQDAPYNALCPMYDATTRCATGCVATAMAQIMYHHKYPTHGVGSKDIHNGTEVEVIDFANTTYEWDLMTPVYSSLSTDAERNAVATLMYHVGRSVNMMYSTASGAVSAESAQAWATYWDYDKAVVHRDRQFYTIEEWERYIIEDIDNGRPILYHGQSNDGGHAFVLDGYNDAGYVHINWGWEGMSNGYFKLHALTPEKQGTGGFSGGYNSGQGAVFGIQPNKYNKPTVEITAASLYIDPSGSYKKGESIATEVTSLTNAGWSHVEFSAGYMIYDENNNLVETQKVEDYSINGSSMLSVQNIPLTLPTTLADGKYKVYLAHTDSRGEWKHVAINVNSQPCYTFVIEGDNALILTEEEAVIWATSVECLSDAIYSNRFTSFSITMANPMSHEYFGSIYVSIYESKGKFEQRKSNPIALSIPAGKEIEIEIPIKIEVSKGNYCVFITDGKKNKMSESYPITVLAEPTIPNLAISNQQITSQAKDLMQMEYTITNNGDDYTGKLRAWILFGTRQPTSSYDNTESVTIKSGESMNFKQTWEFADGVVGETYICSLWYEDSRTGGMTQLSGGDMSFVLDKETGLEEITSQRIAIYPNPAHEYLTIEMGDVIERVAIYNMQGAMVMEAECNHVTATLNVSSLQAGIYSVVATTAQGTTFSKVIIN